MTILRCNYSNQPVYLLCMYRNSETRNEQFIRYFIIVGLCAFLSISFQYAPGPLFEEHAEAEASVEIESEGSQEIPLNPSIRLNPDNLGVAGLPVFCQTSRKLLAGQFNDFSSLTISNCRETFLSIKLKILRIWRSKLRSFCRYSLISQIT